MSAGGLLETATIRMGEDFYKSDARTWWGIYLGNTVSHLQVAATYRYGVPLADSAWQVITRGATTVVVAPDLRPSVPVAIDTSTWREKTESGWARFDKHWVITLSVATLAFTGVEILMVHPRLYWGEVGNDLTPPLLELPISRTYDIFNQNGWGRSLHFLAGWFLVVTGSTRCIRRRCSPTA